MHILSPETDNCPSWISGRERMTVWNISWSISTKECCRPRRGWTRDPLVSSRTAHPTEPPRPLGLLYPHMPEDTAHKGSTMPRDVSRKSRTPLTDCTGLRMCEVCNYYLIGMEFGHMNSFVEVWFQMLLIASTKSVWQEESLWSFEHRTKGINCGKLY